MFHARRDLYRFLILPAILGMLAYSSALYAADDKKKTPPPPPLPDPEAIDLVAVDDVKIEATYYGGTKGKETVPVILVHDWKGSQKDFGELALYLQSRGHAVITIDLRGHGGSTYAVRPDGSRSKQVKADQLKPIDLPYMFSRDMEALLPFLLQKHREGELNIDKLCVVGAGVGALVAINWAKLDWSRDEYPRPQHRQGKNVRALVLMSPPMAFRGKLKMDAALKHPSVSQELSYLILAGKNKSVGSTKSKEYRDSQKINKLLSRYHPEPPEKDIRKKKSLYYFPLDTSLQGANLLEEPKLAAAKRIAAFINIRLADKPRPWTTREDPFGN